MCRLASGSRMAQILIAGLLIATVASASATRSSTSSLTQEQTRSNSVLLNATMSETTSTTVSLSERNSGTLSLTGNTTLNVSASLSTTVSLSAARSATVTLTANWTATNSTLQTRSSTVSNSTLPTTTASPSLLGTMTSSNTSSATETSTASLSTSPTFSNSSTPTVTPSFTIDRSNSTTLSPSPTASGSDSPQQSVSPTASQTPTSTTSASSSTSVTHSGSASTSRSDSPTISASPSASSSPSRTATTSPSSSQSPSTTYTNSPTLSDSPTLPRTPTRMTLSNTTSWSGDSLTFSSTTSPTRTGTNTSSFRTRILTQSHSESSSVSNSSAATDSQSSSVSSTASQTVTMWLTLSNSTSVSNTTNFTTSASATVSASIIPPYTVPKLLYQTKEALAEVFLVKASSYFSDFSAIQPGEFAYDLFAQLRAAARRQGLDPGLLYFLNDDAAIFETVVSMILCRTTYTFKRLNDFFNVSVCHADSVGRACTSVSPQSSCKVSGVVVCSCPALWRTFPPQTPLRNVSFVPGYPNTPAPSTAAPPTTASPAETDVNVTSNDTVIDNTTAPSENPDITNVTLASPRRMVQQEIDFIQLQFVYRLDMAPAFRPSTLQDVIDAYRLLRALTADALNSSVMQSRYGLDPRSLNFSSIYFPSPAPPGLIVIQSSTALLPIAAALVFPVGLLIFIAYKIFKYVRWKMTVGKFDVVPHPVSDANGDCKTVVEDEEMVERLGHGQWVQRGSSAPAATVVTKRGDDSLCISSPLRDESRFDPLARLREDLEHEKRQAVAKKTSGSEGTASSDEATHDEEGQSADMQAPTGKWTKGDRVRASLAVARKLREALEIKANPKATPAPNCAVLFGVDVVGDGAVGLGLGGSHLKSILAEKQKAPDSVALTAGADAGNVMVRGGEQIDDDENASQEEEEEAENDSPREEEEAEEEEEECEEDDGLR